jgi:ribosomal protein L21E
MPATKPRKTIFDSNEFTGPDHWTKPTQSPNKKHQDFGYGEMVKIDRKEAADLHGKVGKIIGRMGDCRDVKMPCGSVFTINCRQLQICEV